MDAVLEETRSVQRWPRAPPSWVGVYFVLAMCLFPEVGCLLVGQKLTARVVGGAGLEVIRPSAKALRDLRRRIGARPLYRLFEVLAGPLANPRTGGERFGPSRTVSFERCSSIKIPERCSSIKIPDCEDGAAPLEGLTRSPIDASAVLTLNRRPSERCQCAYRPAIVTS
ncbi:transposase domain-containing protein [Streptomyces sp. NBC_01455]